MNYKISFNQVVIVILLLLLGILFYNKNMSNFNEQLYTTNKFKPNYRYENRTQYIKKNLNELLTSFNRVPLVFNGDCKDMKLIPATTDEKVRLDLNQISDYIVMVLNKNSLFHFVHTTFGDVLIKTDKQLNKQYIFELFVRDVKNYFDLKLRVNILTFINKKVALNFYNIDELEFSCKGFDYYPIGIPSINQLIPDPMSVIPTGNEVISPNGINFPQKDDIRVMYINSISIENSTLVLHPLKVNKCLDNLHGTTDNVLENTPIEGDNDPYLQQATIRNEWPTLDTQPKYQKAWPCTLPSQDWDELSISTPEVYPTKLCPGLRSSTKEQPLTAEYWRSMIGVPRYSGPNAWLFSPTNYTGIVSSSASQPPP